ncbi:hypothetical protein N7471_006494 [Penicillium samsonianum]|uniref:uncharacterized protein n=1 Tax=Penicillium samsonianum TaxID=1882272 RepID=UPI0025483FEE|nr:uncharacterized protein N7471_006494 [Penicillium samsonianum]KAJ6140008.1 hypothetical protein N7471_006494 [Penicillium samsonianum]
MAMTSERWNEEIGGRIENVEALFIQMVGRVVNERCDFCLAGRGIFPLCVVFDVPVFVKCCGCCLYRARGGNCSLLVSGPGQTVLVPNSVAYDLLGTASTNAMEVSRQANRARRDHVADINNIAESFRDITLATNEPTRYLRQYSTLMEEIVFRIGSDRWL